MLSPISAINPAALTAMANAGLVKELNARGDGKPLSADELERMKASTVLRAPQFGGVAGESKPGLLAAPRGGKSVLLGRIINDVLATKARACVRAVDFGESFAPLVDVLNGRHLRFAIGSERTINTWDYEGLDIAG